ncbi:MAG: T9SS type A sorting domain-containing protein [Ferruginibacter sp.]
MKKLFTLAIFMVCFKFLEAKSLRLNPSANSIVTTSLLFLNCTIPPEVKNFQVACSNDRFTITWSTQFETNSRRFLIYKSSNGMKFDLAATVPSMAPGGNSDISLSYSYTDNGLLASSVYYRLASEDKNGHVSDWGIVTPSCGTMGAAISLMPNPATTQSVLTMNGVRDLMNISVYNSMGQNIYQNRAAGTVYLPAGKWASDIYIVTVTNRRNEVVYQNRLVVQ